MPGRRCRLCHRYLWLYLCERCGGWYCHTCWEDHFDD